MSDIQRPQRPSLTVFIDANALLFLYEHYDPHLIEIAKKLTLIKDAIFITRQIADEIERNKLRVARDTLDATLNKLKTPPGRLPFGLQEHRRALEDANRQLEQVVARIKASARDHLLEVSSSSDKISKQISMIYPKASSPSEEVLQKARCRKERGNPPGKAKDPLGDQISWEQLLEHIAEEKPEVLWVVTGDQDYVVPNVGSPRNLMLNPLLSAELLGVVPSCSVRIFEKRDIAEAINDFLKERGLAEQKFSERELEYFERLAEEDANSRQSWECVLDGSPTPIESVMCLNCEEEGYSGVGEEDYSIEAVGEGYRIVLFPDENSDPEECSNCQSTIFAIDFESLCSHCRHVTESD